MGFFRRLFRAKKPDDNHPPNRRWSFLRSLNDNKKSSSRITLPNVTGQTSSLTGTDLDANKHAIAVAAATAAVAEAALAAAQAAAEVVRLTSGRHGGGGGGESGGGGRDSGSAYGSSVPLGVGTARVREEVLAAVKIQSAFRGYLARRALRALKALVKLQALVRGHIVRKQMADMLRRMQTLVRLQTRARASRSASSHSSNMSALSHHPRCGSNSNLTGSINLDGKGTISGSNWLDRWMEESLWNNRRDAPPRNRRDDERSAKILEVDTWKPHLKSHRNRGTVSSLNQIWDSDYADKSFFTAIDSPSNYSSQIPIPVPSMSSEEVLSLRSLNFPSKGKDEMNRSSESSPQVVSLSSRPGSSSVKRGPFTPTRSECSWGYYFKGYPGHPSYMCNTESSRAKVRSQSAPRQRLDFDSYGPSSRRARALNGSWDGVRSNSELSYSVRYDLRSKTTASSRLIRNRSANSR